MIDEEIVHVTGIPKKLIVFLHGYQDDAAHIDRKTLMFQSMRDVALHIPQAPFMNEIDYTGYCSGKADTCLTLDG